MNCFSENRGRDIFVELLITAAKDSSDCKIINLKQNTKFRLLSFTYFIILLRQFQMGYEENLLSLMSFPKLLMKICSPINSKNSRTIIYWAKSQADTKSNMQHKKDTI